jgi:hypothetical protein
MASPLNRRKQAVDLATPVPRVSRIRRDPPPPVKIVTAAEIRERDSLDVVLGILAVAVALMLILIGASTASWSPSQYTINL